MQTEALRLPPDADLRAALDQTLRERGQSAGFVMAGMGSLKPTRLRLAGASESLRIDEDCELLTLSGSLSPDGSHLHASVSLPDGRVLGGHLLPGSIVRTTAELLIAWLPEHRFAREHDAATGYAELRIRTLQDGDPV